MRLESIQILRGVAASLVFVSHVVVTMDRFSADDLGPLVGVLQLGVDIFFVISGFVMAYSVRDMAGRQDAGLFLARRIWRIAPLLYVLTVAHLALQSLWGREFDWPQILNCFTILPLFGYDYALVPAWTLGYEMAFYMLVAAVVALRLPAVWAIVPLLAIGALTSTLLIEFAYGLIAFRLWEKGYVGKPFPLLAIAAGILIAPLPDARFIAWGIPAALIFVAFLSWEPGKSRLERAGLWLGTISYSLYLSHVVTFDAIAPLLVFASPEARWVILPVAGIVVAWLVYEAVEAPLWRFNASEYLFRKNIDRSTVYVSSGPEDAQRVDGRS